MFDARFGFRDHVTEPRLLNVMGDRAEDRAMGTGRTWIHDTQLETLHHLAGELWPEAEIPAGLIDHVVRDALASDLALGESPETWSPLGRVRPESFDQWLSVDRLADGHPDSDDEPLSARVGLRHSQGMTIVEFTLEDKLVAALNYGIDAFVMAAPADIEEVSVSNLDFNRKLTKFAKRDVDELIIWRIYTGDHSLVRDIITKRVRGIHRLNLQGINRLGILVGRSVKVAGKGLPQSQGDPLYKRRRRTSEMRFPDVASACPAMDTDPNRGKTRDGWSIVVVHGTMSTGIALASTVRNCTGPEIRVLRFEHDTWLPIETNAQQLADLVIERNPSQILFIAHSRGGLVARQATEIIADQVKGRIGVNAITLGTPYLGTPLVTGAKVAFRGVHALMGGLRWTNSPVVDTLTRLGGLAIRSEPPQGITDMSPGPGYLSGYKLRPPSSTFTFAGSVDDDDGAAYGLSFTFGVASEVFANTSNDLVVSTKSSLGGVAVGTEVPCDHFSYLKNEIVLNVIGDALSIFRSDQTQPDSPTAPSKAEHADGVPARHALADILERFVR